MVRQLLDVPWDQELLKQTVNANLDQVLLNGSVYTNLFLNTATSGRPCGSVKALGAVGYSAKDGCTSLQLNGLTDQSNVLVLARGEILQVVHHHACLSPPPRPR